MGLFSFLNKNKQETAAQDSGYYSSEDDDAAGARARAKRASNAGEPAARRSKEARAAAADPVLPEKKRARRRLVGAIALALAVAIGLPMILDSEPRPLATDIDIRIPSKDKVPAQTVPDAAAADTVDKGEEIVAPPPERAAPLAEPRDVAEVRTAPSRPDPDARAALKTEARPEKPAAVKATKAEPKPDTERALAILEDKPPAPASGQKYTYQVAALASQEKVNELQGKLREAGIASFTQKGRGPAGELIRIRVGPFSREEGEKIRAKLARLGLTGTVVPH